MDRETPTDSGGSGPGQGRVYRGQDNIGCAWRWAQFPPSLDSPREGHRGRVHFVGEASPFPWGTVRPVHPVPRPQPSALDALTCPLTRSKELVPDTPSLCWVDGRSPPDRCWPLAFLHSEPGLPWSPSSPSTATFPSVWGSSPDHQPLHLQS